jgi:hypothetical protein
MGLRLWLPLGVFGVAVWVLATFTVGAEVREGRNDTTIGFGVAALAVVFGYLLATLPAPAGGGARMAGWLIGGGVACALLALALQFYQVAQAAEAARRAGDILDQAVRAGQQPANIRLRSQVPDSVGVIGYLCLLLGAGMVACGVRVGTAGAAIAGGPRRAEAEGAGAPAEPGAAPDPAGR